MPPRMSPQQPEPPLDDGARLWNQLVVLTTVSSTMHVVKAICLDADPGSSSIVNLFCLSSQGNPLAEGSFRTEEGQSSLFHKFSAADSRHKVMDIVFEEQEDAEAEGCIVAIRDCGQWVPHANLERMRSMA